MYLYQSILLILLINKSASETNICETCKCRKPAEETVSVNCVNHNLTNIIPNWPITKHLFISFTYNPIKKLHKLPASKADTISLTLKNCSIEDIENNIFIDAINVIYIDLSRNLIESDDLNENIFRGPFNEEQYEPIALQEINLSYNLIKNLDPGVFMHVPNLTYLDLTGNPIKVFTSDIWEMVVSSKSLRSLIMKNMSMEEIAMDVYIDVGVSSVVKLDFSYNCFKSIPKGLSEMFPKLEDLVLTGNPIKELNNQSFSGM